MTGPGGGVSDNDDNEVSVGTAFTEAKIAESISTGKTKADIADDDDAVVDDIDNGRFINLLDFNNWDVNSIAERRELAESTTVLKFTSPHLEIGASVADAAFLTRADIALYELVI